MESEEIKSAIKELVKNMEGINSRPLYSQDHIPKRKLRNALKYIAKGIKEKDVILIVDITIFGSCKEGLVFTSDKLF